MGDISLILGTVLSQMAIGTFVTAVVLTFILDQVELKAAFRAAALSFFVGMVAGLSMMTHLGQPVSAFNALFNLGSSWLSREGLFFGAFMGLNFLFLLFYKINQESLLKPVAFLGAICGLISLITTSLIYTLPAIAAWYSANTLVSFFLTAIMLGVPLGFVLTGVKGCCAPCGLRLAATAALMAFLVTVVHVSTLAAGSAPAAGTAYLMSQSPCFWLRLALLAVAGAYGLVQAAKYAKASEASPAGAFSVLVVLLIVAEFCGRTLFFSSIVRY